MLHQWMVTHFVEWVERMKWHASSLAILFHPSISMGNRRREWRQRMETCHVYTEYKHAYNIFLAKAWRIITTLSILNSNYKIF